MYEIKEEKPKSGRKPRSTSSANKKYIKVRVTEKEKTDIIERAGNKDVSDYLRQLGLGITDEEILAFRRKSNAVKKLELLFEEKKDIQYKVQVLKSMVNDFMASLSFSCYPCYSSGTSPINFEISKYGRNDPKESGLVSDIINISLEFYNKELAKINYNIENLVYGGNENESRK